jgi:hypothetical protein
MAGIAHAVRTRVTDKRGRASATGCGGEHERAGRRSKNSNRINFILNGFKFAPNFNRSKSFLLALQKFQIKYGWKGLEIRNNFHYRNFSRFEI